MVVGSQVLGRKKQEHYRSLWKQNQDQCGIKNHKERNRQKYHHIICSPSSPTDRKEFHSRIGIKQYWGHAWERNWHLECREQLQKEGSRHMQFGDKAVYIIQLSAIVGYISIVSGSDKKLPWLKGAVLKHDKNKRVTSRREQWDSPNFTTDNQECGFRFWVNRHVPLLHGDVSLVADLKGLEWQ